MEETQFDDFKSPETYVNDTIGKVIEKQLTEVEEFKDEYIDLPISMADWKFRRKVTPLRSYESDPLCPFRI